MTKILRQSVLFTAIALFASLATAQTVTGMVRNGTTGKPAAGVEVVILNLSQGMNEAGSTRADAQGRYSLPLSGGQAPHLVRVSYQGANYFKMVPPGMNTADIDVYESTKKTEALAGTARVIRAQAQGNTIQFIELYAVNNRSNPPRTVAGDNTFEIVLPEGAALDEANAQGPNGQPIQSMPSAMKQKNHFAFSFPLRPGETRFQISYHMPYSGDVTLSPTNLVPFDHFVAMIPASMTFEARNASQFSPMADQPGATVQVATDVKPGQDLSFRLAGTGSMPTDAPAGQQGSAQGGTMSGATQTGGPGGGLGPPIDAPDPLADYRWWILGGLAIVMTGGAYLASTRGGTQAPLPEPTPASTGRTMSATMPRTGASPATSAAAGAADTLLAAMKEELFHLEIERQQGQISAAEYEEQKAALDQTLKRALARAKRS